MAERVIHKLSRVAFPKGAQARFLSKAKEKLDRPWHKIANLMGITTRTLTDWRREKLTMSFHAVKLISKATNQSLPKHVTVKNPYWYVHKGAKSGGLAVYRKYGRIGGDPVIRQQKWQAWWEKKGQFMPHPILFNPLPTVKPALSVALAELTGIIMGDGGMTRYQLKITLHHKDDLAYSKYVIALIKKLFSVTPRIHHRPKDSVNNIVVSRSELIRFLVEKIGLKTGNKVAQQIDIPDWIKKNKNLQRACVRGLVDTDGSVFTHTYKVNGKWYHYKKLVFSSRSRPLLSSVYAILKENGMRPRLIKDKEVRLDGENDVGRYFKLISSHNPKHLKRYEK